MEMLPKDIIGALDRLNLLHGARPDGEVLTGGVSSDIWRVDLPKGPICVKRALPKLRVGVDWQAPVERSVYEGRWMRVVGQAVPHACPTFLGQDEVTGILAMAFLEPATHPLWKTRLRDGVVDVEFAALVGETLGRIHAATAAESTLAQAFPTDAIFHDIRLEPYLTHTGTVHRDLADRMRLLTDLTQRHKRALVHGDVSPKNILCGPNGPVFLDAECAWWGDPAFDLAFCLNHLMLKCIWVPTCRSELLESFDAMAAAYLPFVDWETPAALEARAAHLLPALFLARVDGKSPVEYITRDDERDKVRRVARPLLVNPPDRLADIAWVWKQETCG